MVTYDLDHMALEFVKKSFVEFVEVELPTWYVSLGLTETKFSVFRRLLRRFKWTRNLLTVHFPFRSPELGLEALGFLFDEHSEFDNRHYKEIADTYKKLMAIEREEDRIWNSISDISLDDLDHIGKLEKKKSVILKKIFKLHMKCVLWI